jgi:hypothetical protein
VTVVLHEVGFLKVMKISHHRNERVLFCARDAQGGRLAFLMRWVNLWWAWRDLNPQPDRYERPALTIELQAPPPAAMTVHGGLAVPALSRIFKESREGKTSWTASAPLRLQRSGELPDHAVLESRRL